jgi:3-hydroxyisobutyrate dehydrogenase-like beta-hydroxyacid dehydrogenase
LFSFNVRFVTDGEDTMRVAVLGLGAMGAAIARRLEDAGAELAVYNRSTARAREFVDRGADLGATPADAASGTDVAISMVADGIAVDAVLLGEDGVLAAEAPPPVVVDMSTIDVPASERVAARAAERGVAYLRAPVSGNPGVVAAGNLTILVSGDAGALARVRPVLEAIGPTVLHLGEGEQARVMKLALNLMVAGTAQLLAEALVLGEANGLERARMLDVIGASAVGSPLVKYKSAALAADDYTSTFSARLMHKDLQLVVECANSAGAPVPVTALVEQLVQGCIGSGMGDLDFAVLVPRLAREAGLGGTLM